MTCFDGARLENRSNDIKQIRASIGLAPLQDGGPSDEKAAREREAEKQRREEEERERRALEIEERVEHSRRRRQLNEKIEGPTLGDAMEVDVQEGESEALAWVRRSRVIEAEKKRTARLSTMLDEVDQSIAVTAALQKAPPRRRKANDSDDDTPAAGASHLTGVKVAHGLEFIDAGSEMILTLKDGDVLDDEDQLENLDLAAESKRLKAIEKSKKKSAYELLEMKEKSGGELLPQYSEDKQETFTLGDNGNLDLAKQRQLDDIRKKLQGKLNQRREESLDVSKNTVSSDFMTEEEMREKKAARKAAKAASGTTQSVAQEEKEATGETEAFRKPSKKRKIRTQTVSLAEMLVAEAEAGQEFAHSSTTGPEGTDTSSALQKALRERKSRATDISDTMDAYHDSLLMVNDEALEMEMILKRSRNVVARQHISEDQVIQQFTGTTSATDHMLTKEEDNQIVFSETHEFVRLVQPKARDESRQKQLGDALAKAKEAKEANEAKEAKQVAQQAIEPTSMEVDEVEEEGEVSDVEPDSKEEKHVVLDEDIAPTSLAAALEYAKRKNFLVAQKEAGRTKDPRNILHVDEKEEDDDIELSYKDEFGREMTKKEAFRSLSHTFHGRKPGKKKQELRLRQYYNDLQTQRQQANPVQASALLKALSSHQQKSGQAYVVIQGAHIGAPTDTVAKKSSGK